MIGALAAAALSVSPAPAQTAPASPPMAAMPAGAATAPQACPPEHAAMGHCTPVDATAPPRAGPPPAAFGGPAHAADQVWGADRMRPVREAIYAEHGTFRGGAVVLDRLEYRALDGRSGYAWEGAAWYGGDYDRLWIKSEGEGRFGGSAVTADVRALWHHALNPWVDLQGGLRYERRGGRGRTQFAIGAQGTAPYWIDFDVAAFVSTRGDLTARVEVDYDQRLTDRLIVQPRVEFDLAAQRIPAMATRAGLSTITAGLRLRYEIRRDFAPYVGIDYDRDLGDAATRPEGGAALVVGLRTWF